MNRVIIVEGKSDKQRLLKIIDEPTTIVCTYGTINDDKLEELINKFEYDDVYVFVDADDSGEKLRKALTNAFPNAKHLFTLKMYAEVAQTPLSYLLEVLKDAHFKTNIFIN